MAELVRYIILVVLGAFMVGYLLLAIWAFCQVLRRWLRR